MKVLDVDLSAKYIMLKAGGKTYCVQFRDTLLKGIHDVVIWGDNGEIKVEINGTYPPLKELIVQLWRIYLPCWISTIKSRLLHNR